MLTYFLCYVGELFMQFKEKLTDLVLRHARVSLLFSGEPGTTVWVSISTLSLFESTGLLTLSKHLSLSGISDLRIFISCLRSVDGRKCDTLAIHIFNIFSMATNYFMLYNNLEDHSVIHSKYEGWNFNFGNTAVNFWYSTPTEFIFSQTLDVLPNVM